MKKSTLVAIVLVIVVIGIGGLFALSTSDNDKDASNESTTGNQQATDGAVADQSPETTRNDEGGQSDVNEVEIENFAFQPASISVKKGTTVTWTNKDSTQHSVIPDSGDSDAFQGSELLSQGATYSFTFNTPGTYTYHCGPHPQMTGSVTVTE